MKIYYTAIIVLALCLLFIEPFAASVRIPDHEISVIRLEQNPELWSLELKGKLNEDGELEDDLRQFLSENPIPTHRKIASVRGYALILILFSAVSLIIEFLRGRSSRSDQPISRARSSENVQESSTSRAG